MKRMKLGAFKAKQLQKTSAQMDQLLGQVLGNCHDRLPIPPPPAGNGEHGNGS